MDNFYSQNRGENGICKGRVLIAFFVQALFFLIPALSLVSIMLISQVSYAEGDHKKESSSIFQGKFRLGYIPDRSSRLLANRYSELAEYLSQSTGLDIILVPTKSYDQLVSSLSNREVDLAKFGAYTFLQAEMILDAQPLVMRDTDLKFTTSFLVNNALNISNIKDSKGLRFAFGAKFSTSGHLMARYFLGSKGITPETFYSSVEYSGAHDKTAMMVQEGKADIGAVNSIVVRMMFKEEILDAEKVRVFWITPPYVDYVWAVHPDAPDNIKDSLMEAFLKLSRSDPQQMQLLKDLGAAYYLPASTDDFQSVRKIAIDLGLLEPGT